MEYGAEILSQLAKLQGDVGHLKSDVDGLRRDFDRARDESSDRLQAVRDDLCERIGTLSESSEGRHEDVKGLRVLVEQCPHHQKAASVEKHAADRRKLIKGLGAFFGALSAAAGTWWASRDAKAEK